MNNVTVGESKSVAPGETILGVPNAEFLKLAQSMVIAIPHRASEGVNGGLTMTSHTWSSVGAKIQPVEDQFGGFIELQRASMAKTFLDYCQEHPEVDKLVMIDNDENMNWSNPFRLAMWDLPVVSGVVCSYSETRGVFACFTVKDKYGVARFPSVRFTQRLPNKGLIKVHSVGTGLVCIKKDVLEAVFNAGEIPFYVDEKVRKEAVASGVLKHGEDIAFCRQCERLGIDRYVDLSCHAVHYKYIGVHWPQSQLDESDSAEFAVDMRDYFHG